MADFALQLRYEDIPGGVVREAKRFLLDSIGCALAAVRNEDMLAMHRFIEALGGREEATVIGSGFRTNAANAALLNALLIRAIDYNDIYWEQDPSHPSDLIGAVLAAGEANSVSGREALVAIVLAYEFEIRWCRAADPGIREIGWHHASLTQFVSPLVAGRLYGLNADQMVAALGICGSSHFTLGGVVAGHLTHMKNTADPLAVQAGLLAAQMAKEGIEGPVHVLEGKEGLFEVIDNVRWNQEALVEDLGSCYLLPTCSYKAYPTEALTHQPISATLRLMQEADFQAEEVDQVVVETTTRGADILSDPSKYKPESKETADHSLPYVIAIALLKGNVLPESFQDEVIKDERVRDMMDRIKVVADPAIDELFPRIKRARVSIATKDGRSHSVQVDAAKGSPENPMSDEELQAKFLANSRDVLGAARADKVIEATLQFDVYDDIRDFLQGLVSEPAG
jgi:2-methylcitrate dehydratase